MSAEEAKDHGACGNCGGPGDGLEEVRRVYLTVDDRGTVTGSEPSGEPEWWCRSCRSMYPHRPEGAPAS